ncbi:Zinc finger HIT domain-containing protein [Rhizoctonia solani]|uniref:Zinc finger HIT domain-containing protein n=1 Tax=Rhizoctonia solani TaxID=456999 RepID=A0A8H8STN4_9AGAM|nr:Zinc finger HIT domain-containing protein [Rhizoctonia solani]QRW16497.1 Zinc finger HIT domain-containing protein [Rhizoctonia solani]
MSEPVPGPSTVSQCALCSQPSKYTCPRCSVKTCSLVCSKSHKSKDNCSGERDKAKYVPMNEYGWGALADDYSYLEDLGRNVATWGRDLSKGKGKWKGRSPKLEALRVQLATRDIKIQFVAEGMEKRRLNQSSWDPRYYTQSHETKLPGQETKYQAPTLAIRLGSTSAAARPKIRKVFYPLDPNRSLQECLKGQEMVEYPTIDVFASKTVFWQEPPLKKRKTDTGIGGLVGYGDDSQSDSDVSHGAGSEEEGIGILGGYESAEDVDEGLGES